MKNFISLLPYCLLFNNILFSPNGISQAIEIPDYFFEKKLKESSSTNDIAYNLQGNRTRIDQNHNGIIEVNEASQISVINVPSSNIDSINGIEYFINLTKLNIASNKLKKLDVSTLEGLKIIDFSYNRVITLQLLKSSVLEELLCPGNVFVTMDLSGLTGLKKLDCSNLGPLNFDICLEILDISDSPEIEELNCEHNKLNSLDLSNNSKLKILKCNDNHLTFINLVGLTQLETLYIQDNLLTSLDISSLHNLLKLNCCNNSIAALNFTGIKKIKSLNCDNNEITFLNLVEQTDLRMLSCKNNLIASLEVGGLHLLEEINCVYNQLHEINLWRLDSLKLMYAEGNNLNALDASWSSKLEVIDCDDNDLTSLNIHNNSIESDIHFYGNDQLKFLCVDEAQFQQLELLLITYNYQTCTLSSDCSLGMEERIRIEEISVSPNPVSAALYINRIKSEDLEFKIFTIRGEIIKTGKLNNNEIDISKLVPGLYFVCLINQSGKTKYYQSFIKKSS